MTDAVFPVMFEAALRALVAAAVIWSALRLFRVGNVQTQKAAWTLVLAGALVMPLLMRWQWLPARDAIEVPALSRSYATALSWMHSAATPIPGAALATDSAPLPPPFAWSIPSTTAHMPIQDDANIEVADPLAVQPAASAKALLQSDSVVPLPAADPAQTRSTPILDLAWLIYLAVAAVLLLRLVAGLVSALRLWLIADPVQALDIDGLMPSGSVRSCRHISSPVNLGSGIVLPAEYTEWSAEKLRVVLAHERAHVRQGDFYLQLLAGFYTAITWFSPLGWWLKRKLSELGEAMGDRAGLEEAASTSSYAQMLLEFAALPRPTRTGVAMARTGQLTSRIERLLNDTTFHQAFDCGGTCRVALALVIVPLALLTSAALVRVQAAGQTTAPAQQTSQVQALQASQETGVSNPPEQTITDQGQEQPAPAPAPAPPISSAAPPNPASLPAPSAAPAPSPEAVPAPPALPAPGQVVVPPVPPIRVQVPPIPPIHVQIPPLPPMPDLSKATRLEMDAMRNGLYRKYPFFALDGGDTWALVPAAGEPQAGMFYGGHQAEIDQARKTAHAPFLWFQHDGKSYIVEDPSVVAQIEAIEKPLENLRSQMRALGRQQRALGEQLRQKMRLQRQVALPKPDLSKQMADLNAAVDSLKSSQGDTVTQAQLMKLQMQIASLQGQVARAERGLYRQNGPWGAEMGEFGRQMGQLGAQQGRLTGQIVHMSLDNQSKIDAIINRSLHNGKAKPIR
jgi:bla regulator protein blaR1